MNKTDRNALLALPIVVLIGLGVALAGSQGSASAFGIPIFALAVGLAFLIQWLGRSALNTAGPFAATSPPWSPPIRPGGRIYYAGDPGPSRASIRIPAVRENPGHLPSGTAKRTEPTYNPGKRGPQRLHNGETCASLAQFPPTR